MDEVLEKFENALINPDTFENKTNFHRLYKNWGRLGHQEQRRKDLLDVQKNNRNNKLDRVRGILELVNTVENRDDIFKNKHYDYRPSIYVAGFSKTSASYSKVLMMSEWMIEKPEDFHENWYVVPCPRGVRMLVVASQGRTNCYNKYGVFNYECRTALPGGNRCDPGYKSRCCVLDCFYNEQTNTMYIIDLLAWNNQPMTDGETEFRHYWLQTQLAEMPQLRTINKNNKIIFELLPKTPCSKESFNEFMMTTPHFENNTPPLDGLLFYHKRAHYFSGVTPLVGWLFPYMVPEVLGSDVTVDPEYMAAMPDSYVNQADFIQKFEDKKSKKKVGRSRHNSAMDTTPPKPEKINGMKNVSTNASHNASWENVDSGDHAKKDDINRTKVTEVAKMEEVGNSAKEKGDVQKQMEN